MANWSQICKQSLAAIVKQESFMYTALQGEACTKLPATFTELPTYTMFLSYEPTLKKEYLKSLSNW